MKILKNIAVAFLLLFSSPMAYAAPLVAEKGPYLLYRQDHLILRLEASNLNSPRLEWREKGKTDSVGLERDGQFWEADLKNIQHPGTTEYRIVDKTRETEWIPLWPMAEQKSVPPSRPLKAVKETYQRKTEEPFLFSVYGDNREGWGSEGAHRNLVHRMLEEKPVFILHTGDLVASGDKEDLWDSFFADGRELFRSIPFQPTMGNHDVSHSNLFARWFPMGAPGKTYYAFQWKENYFLALDTTIDFFPGSPQYSFLVKTLSDWKGKSPIFVYFHHPPFSGGEHGSDLRVQKYLIPLFEEYGVDIVFAGHDHTYQRIGPFNGVLYVVTAGGGAPLMRVQRNPAIKVFRTLYHYMTVQVDGKTIKGTMKNEQGEVEDSFELDHTGNPIPKDKREPIPSF